METLLIIALVGSVAGALISAVVLAVKASSSPAGRSPIGAGSLPVIAFTIGLVISPAPF